MLNPCNDIPRKTNAAPQEDWLMRNIDGMYDFASVAATVIAIALAYMYF